MNSIIQLSESFNIGNVFDITEEIKKVVSENDEITLDFKNVEMIDILGLQLVLCTVKIALKNGIKLNMININSEIQKSFFYVSLPLNENITIYKNDIANLKFIK